MAEAFELATGYISLSISTRDMGKQIVKGFAGADIAARLAGDKAGSAFSRAFGQKGKFDIKASVNQAAADADRAAKRMAAAREKERKAAAQVKIEEQRLAEVRDKGDAKASELMRAEERLRQAQVKQAAAADELEDQTRQAAEAQDDLADKSARAERAGSRGAKVWGGLKKVGKAAGVAAAAGMTVAAGAAAKFTKDSISAAGSFQSTMKDVQVLGGVAQDDMKALTDLAIEMGAKTSFSAQGAADAMLELSRAGLKPAEIQAGALQQTLTLATAGGLELGDAAGYMVQGLSSFNLEAKDADRVAAALAGAANASTADVKDLGFALSQSAAVANGFGLSVEQTAGALAALTNNGLKGSDAGTSFKVMLSRLIPQTDKAQSAMEELGLAGFNGQKALEFLRSKGIEPASSSIDDVEEATRRYAAKLAGVPADSDKAEKAFRKLTEQENLMSSAFFDAQGNMKSVEEIAGALQNATKDLTKEEKQRYLQTIFGSDAQRAANILSEEGAEGLAKYVKATNDKAAADNLAQSKTQGFAGAMENFQGAIETAQIQLGTYLLPILTKLIRWLANNAVPQLSKFIEYIGPKLEPAVDSFVAGAKDAYTWLKANGKWIGVVAAALGGLVLAYKGINAAAKVYRTTMLAVNATQRVAAFLFGTEGKKGILAQTAALAKNSAAWVANKAKVAGALAVQKAKAFGALLATIGKQTVALARNTAAWVASRGVMLAAAAASKVWAVAQKALNLVMRANPIGLVITAIAALVGGLILAYKKSETFRKIVDAAWAGIKKAVRVVVDWFVKNVVPFFTKKLPAALKVMVAWVKRKWLQIKHFLIDPVLNARKNIQTLLQKVKDRFQWIVAYAKTAFKRGFARVLHFFLDPVLKARDNIRKTIQKIKDRFQWILAYTKAAFRVGWNRVKHFFLDPVLKARDNIRTAIQKIKDRFQWVKDWAVKTFASAWAKVKAKLLDPIKSARDKLKDFLTGKTGSVKSAFQSALDSVGRIWDKIKDTIKKPLRAVIDMANVNFIGKAASKKGINFLLSKIGVPPEKRVPWIDTKGWRSGGYTGRGPKDRVAGPVHMDEHVIRSESRRKLEQQLPGGLDYLNKTGRWPVGPVGEAGTKQNGSGPAVNLADIPAGLRDVVRRGPRRSDRGLGSLAWAQNQVGNYGWYRKCLAFVNAAWDYGVARFRLPTARASMNAGPREMTGTPPAGAAVYWDTGGPAGHVALAMGDGTVLSNDIRSPGRIDRVPQAEINKWGPYRGWWHPGGAKGGPGDPSAGGSFFGKVWDFLKGLSPIEWLKKKVTGAFGGLGDKFGPIGTALGSVPKFLFEKGKSWLSEKLSSAMGNPGGSGVERWRSTIERALAMNGLPTSSDYVEAWLRQVKSESGGNPNAVQKVWDVNMANGNPAMGLLQTIRSTFNAYKFPGHGDIFNGLDNALAAINYAKSTYGRNHLGVIGHGHGYAGGSYAAVRGLRWTGEAGPELVDFKGGERVYTSRQSQAIANGMAGGDSWHIEHMGADAREVAYLLDRKKRQRLRARNVFI